MLESALYSRRVENISYYKLTDLNGFCIAGSLQEGQVSHITLIERQHSCKENSHLQVYPYENK